MLNHLEICKLSKNFPSPQNPTINFSILRDNDNMLKIVVPGRNSVEERNGGVS